MKKLIRTAVLLTFVALLALPAAAAAGEERTIDQTYPLKPGGEVTIESITGKIHVIGWGRDEVRVEGRIGPSVDNVDIDTDGEDLDIEVELSRGRHKRGISVDLTVYVPKAVDLDVETISAGFEAEGLTGNVNVETVAGRVDIEGALRNIGVEAVSAAVTIRSSAQVEDIEIETVSGTVRLMADLGSDSSVSISAVSGSIVVEVPASSCGSFELETFSGSIRNELTDQRPRRPKYGPGSSLSFEQGSCDTTVDISAFSGQIRLEKR